MDSGGVSKHHFTTSGSRTLEYLYSNLVCSPVSNSLYDQETISKYCLGGYHPVRLGDTFKDHRYRVVHKLGWGGFSTVWLARDNVLDSWVALKIATADGPNPSREQAILSSLQHSRVASCLPRLLDSFSFTGPNGTHQCLVLELLGPSVDMVVADYHSGGDRLDPEIILKITRQLLEAVACVHEAGYGHGDISGANIVFTASQLAHLSEADLFQVIGAPETTTVSRADGEPLWPGVPEQLVRKVSWEVWVDEDEEDIRLVDWGEAFLHGEEPAKLAQPPDLRVPETIFTDQFDHRIDLWRVGCTIYSLVFAARPFQHLGDEKVLVAQMIDFIEALPKEWQKNLEYACPIGELTQSRLDRRFYDMIDKPELTCLRPIIQGLMRFLPSERISAAEAIQLL